MKSLTLRVLFRQSHQRALPSMLMATSPSSSTLMVQVGSSLAEPSDAGQDSVGGFGPDKWCWFGIGSPIPLQTLSVKAGSEASLNVSWRCGFRPKARQTRETVLWVMPIRLAIERGDQLGALSGWLSNTTVSRSAPPYRRA